MNALSPFVFALFVACARAGVLEQLVENGEGVESTAHRRLEIGGSLVLEVVPFTDGAGATQHYVNVLYKTSDGYGKLQLVKIKWPQGVSPAAGTVKPSISNAGFSSDGLLTVKYNTVDSKCIYRKYYVTPYGSFPKREFDVILAC